MSKALNPDVFRTLIAIGWIDGELDEEESSAILRAAREEGLEEYTLDELEAATRAPIELDDIDITSLTSADKLYIYAVSSWIAQIDGTVTGTERAALHAVAALIGVTGKGRAEMDATVAELSGRDDAPARLDLRGLRLAIQARLDEAAA